MKQCVEAVRMVYDLAWSTFPSVFLYFYIVNKVLLQKGFTVWLFSHPTFCTSLLLFCAVGRVYDLARRQPTALVTLPFLSRNFLFRAKLLKIIFSSLAFKRRKKYIGLVTELMYEMLKMLIKICLQRAVSQIPRGSSLSLTPMEMNHQIINSTFFLALPSFISAVLSKLFCWVVRTANFWTVSEWFLENCLFKIAIDVVLHDFASCGSSEIVSIFSGGWKHSGVGRSPTAISKSICHTTQNIF